MVDWFSHIYALSLLLANSSSKNATTATASPPRPPLPPPPPPPSSISSRDTGRTKHQFEMANLPPKAPINDLSWPNFQSQAPPPATDQPNDVNNTSWVDDFAGFSAAKRRAHRRSISDVSMAFVEEPTMAAFRDPSETNAGGSGGGEYVMGFDDEAQLIMSMFNNEMKDTIDGSANSSSDPASSSGCGCTNAAQKRHRREEKPVKIGEHEEIVESSKCYNDDDHPPYHPHQPPEGPAVVPPSPADGNNEAVFDPKRVKRILANRQSAQRSRVRKLQYVSELERSITRLQTEVSMLTPRVAYLDHQRIMLNVDNTTLKSKIAALSHDKLFKDTHQEALKREIERLKQLYHQQSSITTTTPTPDPSDPLQSRALVAHPQ